MMKFPVVGVADGLGDGVGDRVGDGLGVGVGVGVSVGVAVGVGGRAMKSTNRYLVPAFSVTLAKNAGNEIDWLCALPCPPIVTHVPCNGS
jgi:hypothetical protein